MKFLISLAVPVLFLLGASSASAAPTIPPSEECLSKMDTALQKFKIVEDEEGERAVWQEVVDAGCLSGNPWDASFSDKDTPQCIDYKTEATPYLAPMNQAMRPATKKLAVAERNHLRKINALARKAEKARKQGKEQLAQKIEKKITKVFRSLEKRTDQIARSNKSLIETYDAPAYLVYGELWAKGCLLGGKWFDQNKGLGTTISLWYALNN